MTTCASEVIIHIRSMYTVSTTIMVVVLFTTSPRIVIIHHTWVVMFAMVDPFCFGRSIQTRWNVKVMKVTVKSVDIVILNGFKSFRIATIFLWITAVFLG